MPLEEYRRKRDFGVTTEPAGAPVPAPADAGSVQLAFVVHKHAARQLHYDVRLEIGGAYASWAIPKGPSLDPAEKRLAVHVEDHPLEYGSFEGVIPAGEYGAGTVMVWDRGTFAPVGDPVALVEKGHVKFVLEGSKLRGAFALIRMKPRPGEKREMWLLMKERDAEARPGPAYDVLAAAPDSAASGRTMEQIAASGVAWTGGGVEGADASRPAQPGALVVAGVRVSNPDKVLLPAGVTKRELARYYEAVADAMLPHLAGRFITAVRCPQGPAGAGDCFYQKHPEVRGWPAALHISPVQEKAGVASYFFVDDPAGLLASVQLGVLEIHTWNSLAGDPDRPDRIVFDLDPGSGVGWTAIVRAAAMVRDALHALGLAAYAKTTGGRGVHVVVPIVPEHGYDAVRDLAHALCDRLAAHDPATFTAKMAKAARPGRVFVDYLRNAHGATAVCAFSTRARPGASVSVPVSWQELAAGIDPSSFTIFTVPRRLASLPADPWQGYEAARERLGPALFAALDVPVLDD